MKQLSRFLFIASITAILAGCKLAVIVVEGGEVQSTGSGTCSAGTVCVINVEDTSFSETFTAIPADGWYFHKWNQGDRFFCGNSVYLKCELSFESVQGEENIETLVASDEVFYLMPVFKQLPEANLVEGQPRVIEVNGKKWEWLQPIDFQGYTDDQYATVCSRKSGLCNGMLPGSTFDLTGYYWALSSDIYVLYSAYGAEPPFDFTNTSQTSTICHDFQESIYEGSGDVPVITGSLRNPPNERGQPYGALIWCGDVDEKDVDTIFLGPGPANLSEYQERQFGAWFWRPVE